MVEYSSSSARDEDSDEILGVNVKGCFEEDSESVDVSEIWNNMKWILFFF